VDREGEGDGRRQVGQYDNRSRQTPGFMPGVFSVVPGLIPDRPKLSVRHPDVRATEITACSIATVGAQIAESRPARGPVQV
jgi:hypothetical protein